MYSQETCKSTKLSLIFVCYGVVLMVKTLMNEFALVACAYGRVGLDSTPECRRLMYATESFSLNLNDKL